MDDLPAQPILEAPSRPNSPSLTHIFDLPEELIVNILSRLNSDDLARIRCVSNTFFDISTEFRSINLLCPLDRYTNSGRPITPFKIFTTDLILRMGGVDSISISVEERANHKSLDVKSDDLYLTEVGFVARWLRSLWGVRGRFTSLSISDYLMHSRGKWSEVLSLISFHCKNLHELVLKNAWLSTNGWSSAMLMLTSLTLAYVRLDDEDLDKVNSYCPSLKILNLILVEGLKNPQIDLLDLRTCQYVGSGLATTTPLQVIRAPNLTRIEVGFEVGFGQRISYIIKTQEMMHRSRTQIVFVPASDFTKIIGAPTHFDQNISFGVLIENYLNLISRNASTNHPVLLHNKLRLVSVEDWALGIQKSPNFRCTQIFLPSEVE